MNYTRKSETGQIDQVTYQSAEGKIGLEFDHIQLMKNLIDRITEDYNKRALSYFESAKARQRQLKFSTLDISAELDVCINSIHRQNRTLTDFKHQLELYESKVKQTEQNIKNQFSKIILDIPVNQSNPSTLDLGAKPESIELLKSSDIKVVEEANKDKTKELLVLLKALVDKYGVTIIDLLGKIHSWTHEGIKDLDEFLTKVKNSPEYQKAYADYVAKMEAEENDIANILLDDLQKFLTTFGKVPQYGDLPDNLNLAVNAVRGKKNDVNDIVNSKVDEIQLELDILGLHPLFGFPADAANSAVSAGKGETVDAAISAASLIPLGDLIKAGKYAKKATKAADEIAEMVLDLSDDISDVAKAAEKAGNGEKVVDKGSKIEDSVEKVTKGDSGTSKGKPIQAHHYASNKSSKYTSQFENVANKYGLNLDDEWNKELMPHQGRHPYAYHDYILDNMQKFDKIAKGDKTKFLKLYEQMKQKIITNPDMLYKDYWINK